MIFVQPTPVAGISKDFVRVGLSVIDDSTGLPPSGVYIIYYTVDGSLPTIGGATTVARVSPIHVIAVTQSTTIKAFAQRTDAGITTGLITQYYQIVSSNAHREARTVSPDVARYTLQINNGDILRSTSGQYGVVYGAEKAKQDIREVILVEDVPVTKSSGNRTMPRFGSALNRIIGQALPSVDSPDFVAGDIQTSIFQALSTLQTLQQNAKVPSSEQIKDIVSVIVTPQSPTDYTYQIVVEMASGEQVSDTRIIRGQ